MQESLEPHQIPEIKTLTLDKQKRMFNVGDKVYVRYNAEDYTFDWVSIMDTLKGKLCEIIRIGTINDNIFGANEDSFNGDSPYDLVIEVKLVNSLKKFYVHYKSLFHPRQNVPHYRPRHIKESIDNYEYNSIIISIPTYTLESHQSTVDKLIEIIELLYKNDIEMRNFNNTTDISTWIRYNIIDFSDDRYLRIDLNLNKLSLGYMNTIQHNTRSGNYTYSKIYEIDDIKKIYNIFKYGMEIARPDYRSRKRRLDEALKNKYEFKSVGYKIENKEESDEIQQFLLDNDFTWVDLMTNIIEFSTYPSYIFATFDNNELWYGLSDKTYPGEDPHIYSNLDKRIFKNIIKYGINEIKPDYRSRKRRLNEDFEVPSYLPHPRVLTLEEQIDIYKLGDEVYIRQDADRYTLDWYDEMNNDINMKGVIKIARPAKDFYDKKDLEDLEYNPDDLIIGVIVDNTDNYWHWHYKSIYHPKLKAPNYKSRIINESNDFNYKYDYILIKVEDEKESAIVQKVLFEFGIHWRGPGKHQFDVSSFKYDRNYDNYPIAIIAQLKFKIITFNTLASTRFIENFLNIDNTDSHLYDITELNNVRSILRSGRKAPNYKPRRIKRINESVTSLLTGKSDDQIKSALDKLDIESKFRSIIRHNFPKEYMPTEEEFINYMENKIPDKDIQKVILKYSKIEPFFMLALIRFCEDIQNTKKYDFYRAAYYKENTESYVEELDYDNKKYKELPDEDIEFYEKAKKGLKTLRTMTDQDVLEKYWNDELQYEWLESITDDFLVDKYKKWYQFCEYHWEDFIDDLRKTSWGN